MNEHPSSPVPVGRPVPMVRVVVLNFNGDPHLFRCLDALAATQWPAERLGVVVVDNASTDGSADAVASRYPQVELRRLVTNTGFPANNEALRDLDGIDYVALVNNDCFVTPGWLVPLVGALEADPELAAACPKLVFAPRFVDVEVRSATFRAPSDSRALGVRLSGVEVDRVDCWRPSQFPPPGFWGIERRFWPGVHVLLDERQRRAASALRAPGHTDQYRTGASGGTETHGGDVALRAPSTRRGGRSRSVVARTGHRGRTV